MSKSPVLNFTRATAVEAVPDAAQYNGISPSFTGTTFLRQHFEGFDGEAAGEKVASSIRSGDWESLRRWPRNAADR